MVLLLTVSAFFALAPLFVAILHITVGMVWRADFLLGRIDSVRSLVEEDRSPGSRNMYAQLVELFNHVKSFASDDKMNQIRSFYTAYPRWSRESKEEALKLFYKSTGWFKKFRESFRYWLPAVFLGVIYMAGFYIGIQRLQCDQVEAADKEQSALVTNARCCSLFPPASEDKERKAYDAILFAFLGCFVFNTGIMVRRVFIWDISGQMYWWALYRTVLSIGLAYVLYYSTNQIDPRYFFLIATASVSILDAASRSLRAKLFQSESVPKQTDLNLQLVQGIDFWKEQRLMEEGIESVQHLATCDFVVLALHTRSPLYTIMDWVDQSIFIQRFPGKVDKLTDSGLPMSAIELSWSWKRLLLRFPDEEPPAGDQTPQRGGRYELLKQLEDATGIKGPIWQRTLEAWSVDNQVSLLTLFWRADLGDYAPPPPPPPSPASTTETAKPLAPAPPAPPPVGEPLSGGATGQAAPLTETTPESPETEQGGKAEDAEPAEAAPVASDNATDPVAAASETADAASSGTPEEKTSDEPAPEPAGADASKQEA